MDRISSYGVVGVGKSKGECFSITEMVEKIAVKSRIITIVPGKKNRR